MDKKLVLEALQKMQNKISGYYDEANECIRKQDIEGLNACYAKQEGIREAMNILREQF